MSTGPPRRWLLLSLLVFISAWPAVSIASGGGDVIRVVGCCGQAVGAVGDSTIRSAMPKMPSATASAPLPPACAPEPDRELLKADLGQLASRARETCRPEVVQPERVELHLILRHEDGSAAALWFEPPLRGDDFALCMQRVFYAAGSTCFEGVDATIVYLLETRREGAR